MNRWPTLQLLFCIVLLVGAVVPFSCAAARVSDEEEDQWVFNVYMEDNGEEVHVEYSLNGVTVCNDTEVWDNVPEIDLGGIQMFSSGLHGKVVLSISQGTHSIKNSTIKGFDRNLTAPIWITNGSIVNLKDMQVVENLGEEAGGIYASDAGTEVHLQNVTFQDNKGIELARDLAVMEGAIVSAEQSLFCGLRRGPHPDAQLERIKSLRDLESRKRVSNGLKHLDSMVGSIYVGQKGLITLLRSEVSWFVSFFGAIHCAEGSEAVIENTRITDNWAYQGSGIFATGASVSIVDGEITRNSGKLGGAMASINGSSLSISGTKIVGNQGTLGGAIYISHSLDEACMEGVPHAKIVIKNAEFISNIAQLDGGAIYSMCDGINVTSSIFQECVSGGNGGGIHLHSIETVVLESLLFKYCKAINGGALASIQVNNLQLSSTEFLTNQAQESGGAIHASDVSTEPRYPCVSALNITSSQNTAGESGGSFAFVNVQLVNLTDVKLKDNKANRSGGGIYAERVQTLLVQDANIMNNRAIDGGGLFAIGPNTRQGLKASRATAVLSVDQKRPLMEETSEATLNDVLFSGNGATGEGGGACIKNMQHILSSRCTFQNNSAGADGGGLYLIDSLDATFHDAVGDQNTCKGAGGFAVMSQVLNVVFMTSDLSKNSATNAGGALALFNSSSFEAYQVTMTSNSANKGAGVMFACNCSIKLTKSVFNDNQASTDGGAILALKVESVTLIFKLCTFEENQAKMGSGGAVALLNGVDVSFKADGCSFTKNQAGLIGGAIALDKIVLSMKVGDSSFADNTARKSGGSMYVANALSSSIRNTSFTGSLAYMGAGALSLLEGNTLELLNCTFRSCKCENGFGGAVLIKAVPDVKVSTSIFTACTSKGGQGGALSVDPPVFLSSSSVLLSDCFLHENMAEHGGGGVYIEKVGTVTARQCQFHHNVVGPGNGGAMTVIGGSTFAITDCNLRGNMVQSSGGALYIVHVGKATISSSFQTNIANKKHGGAIFADYLGHLELSGSQFRTNRARLSGGAVFVEEGEFIAGNDLVFESNEASMVHGGGMSVEAVSSISLNTSEFTTNYARAGGGALWIHELPPHAMDFDLSLVKFVKNEADGPGGAILLQGSLDAQATGNNIASAADNSRVPPVTLRMSHVTFTGNKAHIGGGVHAAEGYVKTESSEFIGNEATTGGGGGFSCGDGVESQISNGSFTTNRAKTGSGVTADCGCEVVLDECSFLDNVANEYEGGPVSGCKDNVIESGSKYSGNVGGKRPWWYYAVVATAGGLSLLILCCGLCCCRILYKTIKKKVKKDRVYTDYAAMGATDSNAEDLNVVVQQRLQALHDSVEFDSSLREIPAKQIPRVHSGMEVHSLPISLSRAESLETMESPVEPVPLPAPEPPDIGPSQSLTKPLMEEQG